MRRLGQDVTTHCIYVTLASLLLPGPASRRAPSSSMQVPRGGRRGAGASVPLTRGRPGWGRLGSQPLTARQEGLPVGRREGEFYLKMVPEPVGEGERAEMRFGSLHACRVAGPVGSRRHPSPRNAFRGWSSGSGGSTSRAFGPHPGFLVRESAGAGAQPLHQGPDWAGAWAASCVSAGKGGWVPAPGLGSGKAAWVLGPAASPLR